jgi:glycosyltransferase involved in cell wall biosynthesis
MQIWFYCPDRHLTYDGATPDEQGVGGGVTARIRVAQALARRGHSVNVACNCGFETVHAGVRYIPVDDVRQIDADVLVLHSSGGGLDLSSALRLDLRTRLKILFLSGSSLPRGSAELAVDFVYAPSNFVLEAIGTTIPRVFVTYYGVERKMPATAPERPNPTRLLYASHPSKGLDAAIEVFRLLRTRHKETELHIYGGERLWGGKDSPPDAQPGLYYHGIIGQRALAREYLLGSFALHLQNRLEPFGLTLVESMAMGCIPLASPVGAYKELVKHNHDGFVIEGDADAEDTHHRATHIIAEAVADLRKLEIMRQRAVAAPLYWDTVVETWEHHVALCFGEITPTTGDRPCLTCGGRCWLFPDGDHCTSCGRFQR